ncbi:acyltransferase family protein [Planctobacterium marinum]|uniref:Membrane protein n=1 Tax=Planctobacterium marinum TaxID=1631968 RepID=A0AA48KQB1_9ALTE|nr:membrane protein [Planctobacterium marinum]
MQQEQANQHILSEGQLLSERRYDIDAVRVLAFGLLIFYHIGMFYVQDWGWHVKSAYQYTWLQDVMGFFNQWRMALLFTISGMATAIIMHKQQPGFIAQRMKQLGVPLVFGMLVVVVPQAYFEAKANGAFEGGFFKFWLAYLSLQSWPEGAFAGSDPGVTWNHLWYLPYIMFYTLALYGIRLIFEKAKLTFFSKINSFHVGGWIATFILVLMLCGTFIYPSFPYRSHALTDDWYTHSLFFSFFVFGYLLIRSDSVWEQMKKHKLRFLLVAIAAYLAMRVVNAMMTEDSSFLMSSLQLFCLYLNRVMWIMTILAFAYSCLNKPAKWLSYGNSAVFSWYILHQTVIVVLGAWLSPFTLGGPIEFMFVFLGTVLSCLAIHHYVIRPVPLLHPVFGVTGKHDKTQHNQQLQVIRDH